VDETIRRCHNSVGGVDKQGSLNENSPAGATVSSQKWHTPPTSTKGLNCVRTVHAACCTEHFGWP
jgi:hypothetical protein